MKVYNVYNKFFSTLDKAREFVLLLASTGCLEPILQVWEIELDNAKAVKVLNDFYNCATETWDSEQANLKLVDSK